MSLSQKETVHPVIHLDDPNDWNVLNELCGKVIQDHELDQLKRVLGGSCKTIVIERNYICKDYRDTYTNFYSKKFPTYPDKCIRLLFFYDEMGKDEWWDWWDNVDHRNSFIGYSVIRPNRVRYIGRTILDPQYCDGIDGHICRTKFRVNFMGVELYVSGFPFIGQDTDVTVCAHAACWMCFRYFSERYPTYPEVYPYQITQLTQNFSYGRLVPSPGLTVSQIAEIFSRYGFFPRIYIRNQWDTKIDADRFNRLLYYYIESGIPIVLGLEDHAIAAIGHVSNYQKPTGNDLTYSNHFLTGLVINDDNELPYQILLKDKAESSTQCSSLYKMAQINSFIVPLYEKIYLAAEDVERRTDTLISQGEFSLVDTNQSIQKEDLVIRTFLTTSRAYKLERRKSNLPHRLDRLYTQLPMPKFVWVSELSTKDIFRDKKIVGEIIWDATASSHDNFSWIVIHYPTQLVLNDRTSISLDIQRRRLPKLEQYDLYCHNLHDMR